MKVIITRDVEVRGDREAPKINAARSLKASEFAQTLPRWMAEQAIRRGAASEVKRKTLRKPEESDPEADAASDTGT